ncbi:hypothetical protein NCC78_05750 [Micromonospora phytophila]|uniref:hypothetical protein n=1 Tax=Micromonospora phytophila TaxID=709888 RepID=UPI002030E3C4|nr:hypothetical protein [Micromonospora phytophila]MCM0674195.1 hypothetical protein [Micromonospora phytophila]
MSYRDWGRGEDGPRERQSIAPWHDPADPSPVDSYGSDIERYRTPSRRRAVERGQQEPVDSYLPRWALESGVRSADGGGRHAAPDDEDDDVERPRSGAGWQTTETTSSWRRVSEASWREVPAIGAAPESDHTREWTFDRPQEQGYAGRRRADDDPVSGVAPQSRPRRSPSRRPQVVWSGLEETDDAAQPTPTWGSERLTRRGPRAAEPPPAADPWDRGARTTEPEEYADSPAVDPWDASGMHAWRSPGDVDRWERSGLSSQADDTGQWDQTGQWQRPDSTGQWDRYSDDAGWDRTGSPGSSGATAEGWPWPRQDARDDGFWSGTRLAGDDPRWMDAPASAPRSPVVSYTAPRPRTAPRRRAAEPAVPPGGAAMGSVRRRIESVGSGTWARRLEDDLLDPDPGGPWRPLLYTAACYLVPAALVFVWLLTLDGQAPAGCVTDISGGGCDSPRARALGSLASGMPRFGLALASSLIVALLLRRVGTTWRSATVALAAAVVGGGLSTVMISAVTGQPIG